MEANLNAKSKLITLLSKRCYFLTLIDTYCYFLTLIVTFLPFSNYRTNQNKKLPNKMIPIWISVQYKILIEKRMI
jgi:hypothetical protein